MTGLDKAAVRPLDTAPQGPDAMEPQTVDVHEGAWALVIGTNGKPAGWIDTHELFAHQLYRDQILRVHFNYSDDVAFVRKAIAALRDLDGVRAELDEWFAEAEDRANSCSLIMRERDALARNLEAAVEALNLALPIVEENFRWHRDMQSSPGRIEQSILAQCAVKAALARLDEKGGTTS